MATLTSDEYLDQNSRSAGEAFTCNGGRLTVRTDTRWHANSPASMTGSLGSLTVSSTLGGGYTINGTAVRWLAYSSGSGNVPAIGTDVTKSGAVTSSYLLGVWASLTSAPTAVGAAMPAIGFLKFREVAGTFTSGALTGIGATADGADVVGWIEVVHDQSTSITVPRFGDFTVRGDWFDLGTTSGSANQSVQVPTNGSANAYVPGVWIETSSGSGQYELYPAIYAAGMTTTNLGTDARSKFVLTDTNGTIRIGHNGTTNVGYVPSSGCKIRIPNVFGRQCATGTRATNAAPHTTVGSRPSLVTTSAGTVDVEYFASDWQFALTNPYSVILKNFVTFEHVLLINVTSSVVLQNGGNGISLSQNQYTLRVSNCNSGTVTDWWCHRYDASSVGYACYVASSNNITLTRVRSGIVTYARNASSFPFALSSSDNCHLVDCYQFNCLSQMQGVSNSTVDGFDHCDRYVGTTNTTSPVSHWNLFTHCDGVTLSNLTCGLKGTISDVHPYASFVTLGGCTAIHVRNIGSIASPVNLGSANQTYSIVQYAGGNSLCSVKRCYVSNTRGVPVYFSTSSDLGIVCEHVYGDDADTFTVGSIDVSVKNCRGTNTTTGQLAAYGIHFFDLFVSNTTSRVVLALNEPTSQTSSYITTVAGTPRFTSAGNLVMATLNDEMIFEQSYFVKGCTALTNSAPVITGTNVTYSSGPTWGNHNIYYQIDTGSGFGGSWKDLNATNLSGETINASTGFRFKIRAVCNTSSTSNLLTYIRINADSTLSAQTNNLYPLDTTSATVTVLDANSSDPVEGAQVLIRQATGATVTITRNGGTASVAHTAHGLSTNQKVTIEGANEGEYNGLKTITVVDANSYTFSVSGSPTSPATGTITAKVVYLNGATDSNGEVTDSSIVYLEDIDIIGHVRKGTAATRYKTSLFSGTLTLDGFTATVYLVSDE